MSHNITDRDTVISVRDAGWHGLATVLDDYVTPEEARKQAFDWEPVTEPLFRRVPVFNEETGEPEMRFVEIPDEVGISRSDTGEYFNAVSKDLGESLEHTNNKALTEIAESVEGIAAGDVRVETAGSLKGGRKVWMLLRMAEPIEIPGDPNGATIPYFALQTNHDGKGSFRGQGLFTRIICDNTSQAADLEAQDRGTEFVFHHTAGIKDRIEEAKNALRMWRTNIDKWNFLMAAMMDLKVTPDQVTIFRNEFLPEPVSKKTVSKRVLTNIETARNEFDLIMKSVTMDGIDGTAYGLVQAAIEFQQHVRGTRGSSELAKAESRFNRAYLSRDRMIQGAVDLAREVATTA
jgi:phage/plasmid-like protein (TIGR03299 family)